MRWWPGNPFYRREELPLISSPAVACWGRPSAEAKPHPKSRDFVSWNEPIARSKGLQDPRKNKETDRSLICSSPLDSLLSTPEADRVLETPVNMNIHRIAAVDNGSPKIVVIPMGQPNRSDSSGMSEGEPPIFVTIPTE